MNRPKIIFIHIPKAAGSSQLASFQHYSPPDLIYWWPRIQGENTKGFHGPASRRWRVSGGHIPIGQFDLEKNKYALYLSLLRDPLDRILSLFNYASQPKNATDDASRRARDDFHGDMTSDGVDPNSLKRSLERSPKFRELCTNYQCKLLSTGEAHFEDVLTTLEKVNFVVGTTSQMEIYWNCLSKLIDLPWDETHINRSARPLDGQILQEPGVIDLIQSLTEEDEKLYHHVSQNHNGLWTHVPNEALLTYFLSRSPTAIPCDDGNLKDVSINAPTSIPLRRNDRQSVEIVINNKSQNTLYHLRENGLFIDRQLYDHEGNHLSVPNCRSLIAQDIPGRNQLNLEAFLEIPPHAFDDVAYTELSLLYEGKAHFSEYNNEHGCRINFDKTES